MTVFRSIAVIVLLASTAPAKTWYVGGSQPDFNDIQPAIDAAQNGDVILVRPGKYAPFTLDKGVMVRASTTPFEVDAVPPASVVIHDLGVGLRGGIAGMNLTLAPVHSWNDAYETLVLQSCQGQV